MKRLGYLLALVLLVGGLTAPARAAAPQSCPGSNGTPTHQFTGTFSSTQEGHYVLVPFDVVAGATKVRVKLCYDQPESPTSSQIKHTLDLGMYDALGEDEFYDKDEFRGWGGSSRLNAFVSPDAATLGFKPGPMPAGTWAGEIGIAAVADQTEGDSGGDVAWRMEVFVTSAPADADSPWQPTPYDEAPAATEQRWYKGDFHVHAEHSSPNDATMRETFDYAFGDRPEGAGLDFITLSDYVTDRHWDEIGRFQDDYPDSLIMRSAEIITYRGHINNHDSHTWVDYRTGPIYIRQPDGSLVKVRDAQPASRIFDDIHAAGGFTQVNHPTTFDSSVPLFSNLCRGCSWEYSDAETNWSKVDAFEVTTGPAGLQEPDGNEPGPNPFSPLAIDWWDRLQAQGFDITGVGSSDSHHAEHEEPTQSPIGEGTTVVLADELSEDGIHEGVLAGHAYVKFFESGGPDLRFAAKRPDEATEVIMGDELEANLASFRARVMGGAPSPQVRTLVIMRDGRPINAVPVPDNDFTYEFQATTPGDYRLQLQRGSAIEALTNPINLLPLSSEPPPDPDDEPEDTTLSFTEETDASGEYTDRADVEARLVDSQDNGIGGAEVELALTGSEGTKRWTETTEADGSIRSEVLLNLRPGHYALTANYEGNDDYAPAADAQDFRILRERSVLDLSVRRREGKRFLVAHLYDHDRPEFGLFKRDVDFYVDGDFFGMRHADRDGLARRRIGVARLRSSNKLRARFEGGGRFKPSADTIHR